MPVIYSRIPYIKSLLDHKHLVVQIEGWFRNYIFYHGHIVGYECPDWGNLIIDWPKLRAAGYKE